MKSLHLAVLATAAAIALLTMPAIASPGPADFATPSVSVTAPAAELAAPVQAPSVCMFAIVEDIANCRIGLAEVAEPCPPIVARVIDAMGPTAVGSPEFLAACGSPPKATPD